VAPGNEWVYAVREFQAGASDSSGADDDNESPVAPVASLEMVRRVSGTRRMQNGDLVVDTSVRLPRFISNVWGECEGEVRESYVLTGGGARLGGYWRSDKCDKLSRPLEITVSYSPAIPWLPLNPDAAGSAPDPIEVTAATRVVGVATAYRKLDCAFTAQPRPQVATPFGSLDGARISTKCVEAEAPTWAVENQEKASAYQAKMDEHKKEVKKPDEKPQAFDDLMLLLGTALWDETPEPEDIPASSFLVLSYSSFESTRTFVPGVGLIRESGRMDLKADRVKATPQDPRMLELRSRLGTDSQSASGRDMATMQDVRLSGMQIRRLSPMSSRPAGVEADPPPILLGETHRDSRSVLGGHSSMLEGGLFGFFRPRYVSVKLRYPDENRDFSSLGHIFSLGFSTKVLPQAMATGYIQSGTMQGKLNGVMPAQTPSGWRIASQSMPRAMFSNTSPIRSDGTPQANSTISMPRFTSPRDSTRVLPCSRVLHLTRSSKFSSSSVLNRKKMRARSVGGVSHQAGKAAAAASTASSTCWAVQRGVSAMTSPVEGL